MKKRNEGIYIQSESGFGQNAWNELIGGRERGEGKVANDGMKKIEDRIL